MKIQYEIFWQNNAKALRAIGLPEYQIVETIEKIKSKVNKSKPKEKEMIRKIAYYIETNISKSVGENYLSWIQVYLKRIPIIILLIGITGVGKTKISYELIERLNDVTYIPTELLREVLRAYLPKSQYPYLWKSSYNAWELLKEPTKNEKDIRIENKLVIEGYLKQNQLFLPALKYTVNWGCKTRRIMLVEGINIDYNAVTYLLKKATSCIYKKRKNIFPFLLVTKEKKVHQSFLEYRSRIPAPPVPLSRYKKYYPYIRIIQEFLISEARKDNIPILDTERKAKEVANEILEIITKKLKMIEK